MAVYSAAPRIRVIRTYPLWLGLLLLLALHTPAGAQTLSTGSVSGEILSTNGQSLDGVLVTLSQEERGWEESLTADRTGRFTFRFLDPGDYDLHIERIGFVPLRVSSVRVRAAGRAQVALTLRPSAPPVVEVDRTTFSQVMMTSGSQAEFYLARDLAALPSRSEGLSGLSFVEPFSGPGFQTQGLPSRFTGLNVDGLSVRRVHPPVSGTGSFHPGLYPLDIVQELEFIRSPTDVEWGYEPGSLLRASTRKGGNTREFSLRVGGTGGPLGLDAPLAGELDPLFGPEVTASLSGPITPDTAYYRAVLDLRRVVRPQTFLSGSSLEDVMEFRRLVEGQGEPLSQTQGVGTWDVASFFGRIDWTPGDGLGVSVRTGMNLVRDGAWDAGLPRPDFDRFTLESREGFVHGGLTSRLGESGVLELRLGLDSSVQEYGSSSLQAGENLPRALTFVHRGGVLVGTPPETQGEFGRTGFTLETVLHYLGDRHQVKGGLELGVDRHEALARPTPESVFLFPTVEEVGLRRGFLAQFQGSPGDVSYTSSRLDVFVQDRWMPNPSFSLTAGLRFGFQNLPLDDLHFDERWFEASGIRSDEVRDPSVFVSPRVSWEWNPGGTSALSLSGSAALRRGQFDPAILMEVLGDTGVVSSFRSLGSQEEWPRAGAVEPGQAGGRRLSLLGPRFDQPLTRTIEGGISLSMGSHTHARVGAEHRRTDFLPRRRDLNRVPERFAEDQFGREIFGEILQQDGLIGIQPGSDRRFPGFDMVSGLESDGWSRWSGVTVALHHSVQDARSFRASYTWSTLEDNLPLSEGEWPLLVRERPSAVGGDPSWFEGTSDLHRPHHFRASGTLRIPVGSGITLGGVYSLKSGRSFTPTVRDLLGAVPSSPLASHPISIPQELTALTAPVESDWPCLSGLRAGALERNQCRAGSVHFLDARIVLSLPSPTGHLWSLVVDGFNLLDADDAILDPALFLADGTGSIQGDSGSDRISLPVVLNPGFGEPLFRSSTGRSLRVGLTMRF